MMAIKISIIFVNMNRIPITDMQFKHFSGFIAIVYRFGHFIENLSTNIIFKDHPEQMTT